MGTLWKSAFNLSMNHNRTELNKKRILWGSQIPNWPYSLCYGVVREQIIERLTTYTAR